LACALSALARALADKGKKEEASRVAAEAVSAVGQKKLNKDYSAYATACALAQGGLTGDVMAVIHQLEDEGQRAAKLVNAVHAAVQSGKTEEALALAAAPEIDGYHVWALSAVAQALARIGRMEEADRLARKAQAVAEEQLSVYGANEAGLLVEAAQALAKVGRTAEANNLAQRAMAMAPRSRPRGCVIKWRTALRCCWRDKERFRRRRPLSTGSRPTVPVKRLCSRWS